jgi:hypothetical protein
MGRGRHPALSAPDTGERDAMKSDFGFNHAAQQFFFGLKVGDVFTADDLVEYTGLPDEGPNKNNAVGAWINSMSQGKFIKWTGRTVKSERPGRHQGTSKEWIKVRG